jgi:hypothetical protein
MYDDDKIGEVKNIPYEDFVIGVAQGTMRFEVAQKRKFAKLYYDPFVVVLMRVLTVLLIAPFIAIPVLCYMFDKWILLFGYLGIILFDRIHLIASGTTNPMKQFVSATCSFAFAATLAIFAFGILSPIVFTFSCGTYYFFILALSNTVYDEIAKKNLIKNADKYYFASENNIIQTFHVP